MSFFGSGLELVRVVLDVLVVAFIIYQVIRLFRGTRAFQAFIWLAAVIGLYTLSNDRLLGLATVNWFLSNFMGSLVILVIILFQEDIRRALGRLYWVPGWLGGGTGARTTSESAEQVVDAARALSARRIGALIAMERTGDLSPFEQGSIPLDAALERHLLFLLFVPAYENPTHDGAIIVRNNRIVAAHCILPLSENLDDDQLGTRHRAALGLSEQTDALVVVVSEETGRISVARGGKFEMGVEPDRLRELLLTDISGEGDR
jgi:diadenylate cyclase